MSATNVFGPDRDDKPGITSKPGRPPAQITNFMAESGAIHSRSRGWLPAVTLMMATDDGKQMVGTIESGEELVEIACSIIMAYWRSQRDVAAGIADGSLR